jgi:hypothetical protein
MANAMLDSRHEGDPFLENSIGGQQSIEIVQTMIYL